MKHKYADLTGNADFTAMNVIIINVTSVMMYISAKTRKFAMIVVAHVNHVVIKCAQNVVKIVIDACIRIVKNVSKNISLELPCDHTAQKGSIAGAVIN